ncbi:esterase family protein [Microbacterium azadirachtae]|uniref:alpha/beta hydrolase n=1 Tax=Microbacterium azadirachtae TaxID=582680 RepID=UPI0021D4F645|nr:esterase family protein [Microbacterium azadirachtae]UXW86591.1 esterase family protein [Microbacterium azadirachtae]
MPRWLLELNLVDGPVPWVVWGIAAAGVIALLIRPLRRRWAVRALIALVIGGVLGWAIVAVSDATNAFELPLPSAVKWWTIGGFAAIGLAIVSLWDSRWWRKVVAILTIIGAVLSMGIGINQAFGLDRTLGDILGVNTLGALDHFAPPLKPGEDPPASLAAVWKAPADMPARGRYGALSGDNAPRSTDGFRPRNATIYLPPAALVKDPPALPVVVFMMGLPGYPNPHPMVDVMNEFAAKHDGLAPIVIIADQLGAQNQNPGCIDSAAYGGVETYFNTDIPNWIRGHLRVLQDPKYWTISGYSNGGACAFIYGARHPDIWGNIATASGEPWAGFGDPKSVEKVFRGDKAAFDANKPQAILAEHPGAYDGHYAIFAAGALDKKYGPANRASADLAEAAGFTTTFYLVPNATHTGPGLRGGLEKAFDVLYPRLGLAR